MLNAGICGSDPFFGYKIYDSLMYRFSPDIVIQSFAKQDVYEDMAFRGGFDRFTSDGRLQFTHRFYYEKLYNYSYLSRIYFNGIKGVNLLYISNKDLHQKQPYFKEQLSLLMQRWNETLRRDSVQVFFVLRPDVYDISHKEYDPLYASVLQHLYAQAGEVKIADLKPFYKDTVQMANDFNRYYWPQDGHHTPLGYYYMAEGTAKAIADALPKKAE